jgi:hypothetical protein
MALCAIMIEIACNVIRVGCLLELSLMALETVVIHQLIVAIGVARLTLLGHMSTGQWEPGCTMIECCTLPVRC